MNETNRSNPAVSGQTAQPGKRLGTAATAAASVLLALGMTGCVGKGGDGGGEKTLPPAPGLSNASLSTAAASDHAEIADETRKIYLGTLPMTNSGTEGAVLYSGVFSIENSTLTQTQNEWTALEVRDQDDVKLFNINKESSAFALVNTGAPSDKLLQFNNGAKTYRFYATPLSQGAVAGQIWKMRLSMAKFRGADKRSDLTESQLTGMTNSGSGTFGLVFENVTVSAPPAGVGAIDNVRDGVLLAMLNENALSFETKIKPLNLN